MREGIREAEATASASVAGPDSATLAERFIHAFPLPYGVSCILIGFALFGVFDTALSKYVESANPSKALQEALSLRNLAQSALIAYAFYGPRYMRRKLAQTGSSVPSLLGDEARGFRNPFTVLASVRPQVVTWVAFLAALLFALNVATLMGSAPQISFNPTGPFSILELVASLFSIVSLAMATLALSSVVWTYYTITMAVHRFSEGPLELRPYYEDPFVGLRPIGSLALALASVYFGFIVLLLLSALTSPEAPTIGDILGVGGFLFGLIVLGVFLFFLPLTRLHRRMVAEKRNARRALLPALKAVFEGATNPGLGADYGQVLRIDLLDRKLSEMAVWPYDIGILGRLSVIAVSVTGILISRMLALLFHI